jgi:FkbM family methyltransferase
LAEERESYVELGWGSAGITWVESQPNLIAKLNSLEMLREDKIVQATAWDVSGLALTFNVSNNSQSSSLLNFGTHKANYPSIDFNSSFEVVTVRLDDIFPVESRFDLINLDIQGAELHALRGLGSLLHGTKWVYSEVNKEQVYKGCSEIDELDSYLNTFGFTREATIWVPKAGWGDALWVHESVAPSAIQRAAAFLIILLMNFKLQIRFTRERISR